MVYLGWTFFFLLECKKRKVRSHGERKTATLSAKLVLKNAKILL